MHCRKGFTLIELLIVVAIIAILAAIAVPNFLEAQMRSKVSRVAADLRNLRVAIEAYAVDQTNYPLPWHNSQPQFPEILSSPIAYLQGKETVLDPFQSAYIEYDSYWRLYGYWHFKSVFDLNTRTNMEAYRHHPQVNSYLLSSYGPDRERGWFEFCGPYGKGVDGMLVPPVYDPTNGTMSSGDIVIWGP